MKTFERRFEDCPKSFSSLHKPACYPSFYPPPPGEEGCQVPTRSLIGKERQRSDTTDTRGRSMHHSKLLPLVISTLIGQSKASFRPISILYCRTFAPSPRPEPSFPYQRNTLPPPQNPRQPIEPAIFTYQRNTLPPPQNPRQPIEPLFFPYQRTFPLPAGDFISAAPPTA